MCSPEELLPIILVVSLADFRARLDTRQVESELDAIFRESPEFGRTLAHRLSYWKTRLSLSQRAWFIPSTSSSPARRSLDRAGRYACGFPEV